MNHLPERGDIVWVSMDPTQGTEQRGHRPHLVLSNSRAIRGFKLITAVPMTSKARPWVTRIEIAPGSYALAEQVRTFHLSRVTRVDRTGHDTRAVVEAIHRLLVE